MPASSSGKSEPRRLKRKRKLRDDDVSNNEDEDHLDDDRPRQNPNPDPAPPEIVSAAGAGRISDFPAVVRHKMIRHHPSVITVAAARGGAEVGLENLSHGQLQAVSVVPRDCPLLLPAGEAERAAVAAAGFVITPPQIVGGRGVVKRFEDRVHVVPMHADWFSPHTVHRLERQVVPHFFSTKSAENTLEKYMECRNRIVKKYMENPDRKLTLIDCQRFVTGFETDDLTRVVRFLDHWGIINYCTSAPDNETQSVNLLLREDSNGEIHVPSAALKSINSLIQFEKSICKLKAADIYPSLSCHDREESDLDSRIRNHFSKNICNHCSRSVPIVYYQSQKEVALLLCMDCFNDGRFVVGHSSLDFVRLDTSRDHGDLDGESWTNQETLLLLEAIEIYNENWNKISEHVGTKSKAQCIHHFISLLTEDGPLDNIEIPREFLSSSKSTEDISLRPHSSSNGDSAGYNVQDPDLESELPFANSANPVMVLVAFLASAVGPRVAATCAHTSLAVLSEESQKAFGQIEESGVSKRTDADNMQNNRSYYHEEHVKSDKSDGTGQWDQNGDVTPLSADKVITAAKAGLSAAATKAKLFADHEEHEIQRLSANIMNHQLKRLELKLKQFAEVETLLMRECEQMEKSRQRVATDRARMMSATPSMTQSGIANSIVVNHQPVVTAQSQPFISPGYVNNHQIHPQFMGQQHMYGLGPRLPLSALHPFSSANAQPSPSHQILRSLSGASF